MQNCQLSSSSSYRTVTFAILYRSVIGTTLLQVDPGYLQLAHRETSRQLDLFAVFFEFPRRLTQRQVVHSTSLQKTRSAGGHQRNVYDAFGTKGPMSQMWSQQRKWPRTSKYVDFAKDLPVVFWFWFPYFPPLLVTPPATHR